MRKNAVVSYQTRMLSNDTIGGRFRNTRIARGVSLRELEKKCRISRTSLQRFEVGLQFLYLGPFADVCRYLNVSTDYILGLSQNQRGPSA